MSGYWGYPTSVDYPVSVSSHPQLLSQKEEESERNLITVSFPNWERDLGESYVWFQDLNVLLADLRLNLVKNRPIGKELLVNGIPAA